MADSAAEGPQGAWSPKNAQTVHFWKAFDGVLERLPERGFSASAPRAAQALQNPVKSLPKMGRLCVFWLLGALGSFRGAVGHLAPCFSGSVVQVSAAILVRIVRAISQGQFSNLLICSWPPTFEHPSRTLGQFSNLLICSWLPLLSTPLILWGSLVIY